MLFHKYRTFKDLHMIYFAELEGYGCYVKLFKQLTWTINNCVTMCEIM